MEGIVGVFHTGVLVQVNDKTARDRLMRIEDQETTCVLTMGVLDT
jgi:hypothetical protein